MLQVFRKGVEQLNTDFRGEFMTLSPSTYLIPPPSPLSNHSE
jgi:hypothetical protein